MNKNPSVGIKNPRHLQRNIFLLYLLWKIKVEPASFTKIDTEVIVFSPTQWKGYITSKLKSDEINELFRGKHHL